MATVEMSAFVSKRREKCLESHACSRPTLALQQLAFSFLFVTTIETIGEDTKSVPPHSTLVFAFHGGIAEMHRISINITFT